MKNKINVAICDDNNIQLEILEKIIKNNFAEYDFSILKSNDSTSMLKSIEGKNIDVALLDIEMPVVDGIDLGLRIKEVNSDAIIVYITGFAKHSFKSFAVKPFDYVIKPLNEEKVVKMARDIKHRFAQIKLFNESNKFLTFLNKEGTIKLKYDEIIYFEKVGRQTEVHTEEKIYSIYTSLYKLAEEIDMDYFVQCHQSFIVNKYKINSIKKGDVILKENKGNILVSRKYKQNTIDIFNKMIFD